MAFTWPKVHQSTLHLCWMLLTQYKKVDFFLPAVIKKKLNTCCFWAFLDVTTGVLVFISDDHVTQACDKVDLVTSLAVPGCTVLVARRPGQLSSGLRAAQADRVLCMHAIRYDWVTLSFVTWNWSLGTRIFVQNCTKMPKYCVVGGCCSTQGHRSSKALSFFRFPTLKQKERRRQWVRIVQTRRKDFNSTSHALSHARVCSKHFRQEDFEIRYSGCSENGLGHFNFKKQLKRNAVSSVHFTAKKKVGKARQTSSRRQQTRVSIALA